MKILIDICHPAHAHFFRNPIELLKKRGHDLLVTSRVKEVATDLLDDMGIEHQSLSSQTNGSITGLLKELVQRDYRLYRVVREYRPHAMAAIGGTFISHVGFVTRTSSLVFYDTETAKLQNAITYPFASHVYVPECYTGSLPDARTTRYRGYHELSYLHPNYFHPDRQIAIENGLLADGDTFLIRLVSWKASHDVGEHGWTPELLRHVLTRLENHGRVLITSEAELPADFSRYRYNGDPSAIHHVMAYCRGYVGESATMASECAVLGVPAVYVARTVLGYTSEQEVRFGLVKNVPALNRPDIDAAIAWLLDVKPDDAQRARARLLEQSEDVAAFVAGRIEAYAAT